MFHVLSADTSGNRVTVKYTFRNASVLGRHWWSSRQQLWQSHISL